MSLLSMFTIGFETDAKDATKEVEGLDDALEQLGDTAPDAAKGVDEVSQAADSGSMSIGGLTKTMGGLLAAYVSFDLVASGIMDNALRIDEVGKFSQTIGENIVEMEAWGESVARNGGSADAFRGSVESLNTSLADIKISGGGEVIDTLAMMGIQATTSGGQIKSAFDVLPELADSFQGLSTSESFSFGKKLGLDQGTILLLQQGRDAVDDLVERQKMLGGVTEEGYEAAANFNDQVDDSKRVFNSLWMSANATILPLLTDMLSGFEAVVIWVRQNQDLVSGFFIAVGSVITAVYLPAITSAAAATIAAAAPFIAIGAAITAVSVAFAVLYEDFVAWSEGAPSLLGDTLGSFEDFKESVLDVFDSIAEKWASFIGFFKDTASSIGGFFSDVFGSDGNVNQTAQNTQTAVNTYMSYGANPLNSGGSSSYNRYSQNINIEVGGTSVDARGMDAGQAQKAFSQSQQDVYRNALGQLEDGIAY